MFVVLVYDIEENRVNKVLKTCRKYLSWVQNSVLEGNINKSKLKKLKSELDNIIEPENDSVIIYRIRTTKYTSKEIIGKEKSETSPFL